MGERFQPRSFVSRHERRDWVSTGNAQESFRVQSVVNEELVLSNAGETAQLYRLDVLHLLPGIGKEIHLCICCLR
jgi:hypothetical protein